MVDPHLLKLILEAVMLVLLLALIAGVSLAVYRARRPNPEPQASAPDQPADRAFSWPQLDDASEVYRAPQGKVRIGPEDV